MWCWQHLLKKYVDLSSTEEIVWWSDGGRHFRAASPIATMLVQGMKSLCSRSELRVCHEVQLNFGVPAHFKNAADGAQAHARGVLQEMARSETISTLEQFVDRASRLYSEYREGNDRRMQAQFHLVFPDVPRKQFVQDYCRMFRSMPEQIGMCQSWTARLNDVRRKVNPEYQSASRQLTGITLKANMLADARCPASRSIWPILVDLPAGSEEPIEAADPEDAAEEAADAAEIAADGVVVPVNSQQVDGWLCSYRRVSPELKDFSHWRERFSKMRSRWTKAGLVLHDPRTKRPIEEQKALQKTWADRRKKRPAAG